jgi:hypothetical protein
MLAEFRPSPTAQSLRAARVQSASVQHFRNCFQGTLGRLGDAQRPLSRSRQQRVSRSTRCAAGNGQHAGPQADNQLHTGTSNGRHSSGGHTDRCGCLKNFGSVVARQLCNGKHALAVCDAGCLPMYRHDALPLSLYHTYTNLPCDGKVRPALGGGISCHCFVTASIH